MTILDDIFAHKRIEVEERKRRRPLYTLRREAESQSEPRDFVMALRSRKEAAGRPALIAEVKAASPSKGVLVENFNPLALALIYAHNGAAAISVLTDERFFKGSLSYLSQIAQSEIALPLLRKDFLYDPYQVYEARAAGADAVLLIAASLDRSLLYDLHALTCDLGMAALVEVHSREELEAALQIEPLLVGVNNRDLRDFTVRLETTLDLRPHIPPEVCMVAESGIHTREDVDRLSEAGVDAILVGEALVTAPDVGKKVQSLS